MGEVLGGTLRTDSNGRTTLTGAGSDIDFGDTVEKIIEAKRQPAVRLENRIAENQTKVDAMTELQSLVAQLEDAASVLRGRPTFDNSGNVFEQKEGFLTASRADNQSPSTATSILTANVENSAQVGSHSLEVLQTARGQQVASDSFADASADLTFTGGGGDFTVNGRTISVADGDSLLDVRDKINAANSGNDATGVSASVASVSDTQNILTLSAEEGQTIGLDELTNSPLQDLGLFDGASQFKNPLQDARSAVFRADGLSDGSVQESTASIAEGDTANALATLGLGINSDGAGTDDNALDIAINNGVRTLNRTIQFDADNESLEDVAQRIDDEVFGVSARVVTAGGQATLEINAEFTGDLQRSDTVANATDPLDTLGAESETATLRLTDHGDGGGQTTDTITIDTTADSLTALRDAINGTSVATAQITTVNGGERLNVVSNSGGKLSITDESGTLAADLGIDQVDDVPEVTVTDDTGTIAGSNLATQLGIQDAAAISRTSNTVDDLFQGTTLDLFKAERGTTLDLSIERDEDAVNEAINAFVESFNAVRQFVNAQREGIALEGQDPNAEDSIVGVLEDESILREVDQRLSRFLGNGAQNVSTEFQVLAQAGIDFVNNDNLSDVTLEDTLEIDQQQLNDALLNDFEDLRGLLAFNFSSTSSRAQMIDFTAETGATDAELRVVTDANGDVTQVDLDGATLTGDDIDINGNRFTIQTGALTGLTILFDDESADETFNVSTSTGIASEAFFAADKLSNNNANDGVIQGEIDRLVGRDSPDIEGVNERLQERIGRIDRRLEAERERLTRQFIAMEQALIELESARDRLEQFASAGSDN